MREFSDRLLDLLEIDIITMAEEASQVAEKIIKEFNKPFILNNSEHRIGISIGISLVQDDNSNPDTLLRQADIAMYQAKTSGRNRFSFYDPDLQASIDQIFLIEKDLHTAIEKGQISAFFQPQIGSDGAILGAEALVRWHHPEKGIIFPDQFIPVAEQSGIIHKLQEVVLKDACQLILDLQQQNICPAPFTVSINISANQFKSDLKRSTLDIVSSYKLSASYFKLEITESMLMDDIEAAVAQMQTLKDYGFSFSIDDFGTGYSSLSYLDKFPVDELKIDRSFINKLSGNDSTIVDAIISIANHFGFSIIAEGVETREQATLLKLKSVPCLQGYYFEKPIPAMDFIDWVASHKQN